MSEILQFIVENFRELRPTDYGLLVVFVCLAAGALFLLFRWLYSQRFQAQKDLLDIQSQTLSTLASHLDGTKRERDELRRELDQKMQRLKELEGKGAEEERAAILESAFEDVTAALLALFERLTIVYQALWGCSQSKQVVPVEAARAVAKLQLRVDALHVAYSRAYQDRTAVPELVRLYNDPSTAQIARSVFDRFMALRIGAADATGPASQHSSVAP